MFKLQDQEKAFHRVDHYYLFSILEVFSSGKTLTIWIRLLYSGTTVIVKVGEGLSRPVPIQRGIRQGCPELTFANEVIITVSLSAIC